MIFRVVLGTHADTPIYQGNLVVGPIVNNGIVYPNAYTHSLYQYDFDQPFTMSGTTIGRVQVPLMPCGNGADLLVSLCQDSSGNPGTMITQTRIPASWISLGNSGQISVLPPR